MQQFPVDDDVAALVERLAKKRPFEDLSFSDALRRILSAHKEVPKSNEGFEELDEFIARFKATGRKKEPSPSVVEWASNVAELKGKKGLNTWKAVCDSLKIDTGGDSARRRLKKWVETNKPAWPEVPGI